MIDIAGGIVIAVLVLVIVPLLVMAVRDWRWWRCWAIGHAWESVAAYKHSTGVLSRTVHHKCRRCGEAPSIFEEIDLRRAGAKGASVR